MAIRKRTRKDGKPAYLVRVNDRDPVTGERRWRNVGTYRTKREAETAERDALTQRDRGTLLDPDRTTVAEVLTEWLRVKAGDLDSNSERDYEIVIRRHLSPALGGVPIQKLTADRVQAQYDTWTAAGMSARQVRGCHLRLSQALDYAVSRNLLYANVCQRVTPPRLPAKAPDVWTAAEVTRFLDTALHRPVLTRAGDSGQRRPDDLHPLWHLLALEGMRRGEALGLRWRDITWERGTAHIVQTVTPDKTNRGAPVIRNRTKTRAGARTVKLTGQTLAALKAHRKAQAERRLAAPEWIDHDLIVCTGRGTPVNPNNVSRSFEALVKAAGLRRIRVHDLRHTHATMLLLSGVSAKVVSERLGHASIAITLDTYSHVLPDMQDAAAAAIDAVFDTAQEA